MMNGDSPIQELSTAAVMLAAVLAACGQPSEPGLAEAPPPASAVAGPMSDSAIATRVSLMLQADRKLQAARVAVASQGGRVTLTGTSPDPDARQRVAQLAAGVPGVRSVYNQVVVTDHG